MQNMDDIKCYTCGTQGHMSFDCGKAQDRPWPADAAALDSPVPRFLLLHSTPDTLNTRFAMEPFPGDYASPQHLITSEKQIMISQVQAKSAAAFGAICGPVRADQKRALLSTRPESLGASGLPGLDSISWKLKSVEKLPGGREVWNNYLVCVSRLNKVAGTHASRWHLRSSARGRRGTGATGILTAARRRRSTRRGLGSAATVCLRSSTAAAGAC